MFRKCILTVMSIVLCASLFTATGCTPADQDTVNEGTFRGAGTNINPHGGANRGVVESGRAKTPMYRNGAWEEGGPRNILPFAAERRRGMGNRPIGSLMDGTQEPHRRMAPFGFIEHADDDPDVIYQGYGSQTYVDREVLADLVSQVVVGMPEVETATVLVTDQDCIIGYTGTDDEGQYEDMTQAVEMSGLSVTPRWYKVYASNDPHISDSLREVAYTNAEHRFNYEQMDEQVDQIIEQLGGPKETWEQPGTGRNDGDRTMDGPDHESERDIDDD
jgi:hypothetical protein